MSMAHTSRRCDRGAPPPGSVGFGRLSRQRGGTPRRSPVICRAPAASPCSSCLRSSSAGSPGSWVGSGYLTDLGFLVLARLTLRRLRGTRRVGEVLATLRRRWRLVLFGGSLVWTGFCYDYVAHWMGRDPMLTETPFSASVLAQTACLHALLILCATVGLLHALGPLAGAGHPCRARAGIAELLPGRHAGPFHGRAGALFLRLQRALVPGDLPPAPRRLRAGAAP